MCEYDRKVIKEAAQEIKRLSEPCPTCQGEHMVCSGACHGTGRVAKGSAEIERLRIAVALLQRVTIKVESLSVYPVEFDDTGEQGFEAHLDDDGIFGYGVTAEGAMHDLANKQAAKQAGEGEDDGQDR